MGWLTSKPVAFDSEDYLTHLIKRSHRIDVPEQDADEKRIFGYLGGKLNYRDHYRKQWVRDQVVKDAQAFAAATGWINADPERVVFVVETALIGIKRKWRSEVILWRG